MRLRVHAEKTPQGGWELKYPGIRPHGPAVQVPLVSAGSITLPQSAAFDPSNADNRDLALAVTALKSPKQGDIAKFGDYLFEILLSAVWEDVLRVAENDPLEVIELASADPEFHRLPWEMARSSTGFLAKQGIGFVRLVPSAAGIRKVTVSPRVLFVVGSDLNDKRVKAGAEYLGLLRRLEATSLVLETHILVRATRKTIEETVRRLQPSIVVFICHGSIGALGTGQLELMPDDRSQKTDYVTGSQLRDLLHGIPQAVIMNACETGASSRSSVPIAWEMVNDEIPIAIGMTGRVADRACRLFTRRFFEALLGGENVDVATALARREGMVHGSDPELTVDWAMPALFMLEGVQVKADTAAIAVMSDRADRAKAFRKIKNPLVVCGRSDCISAYHAVVGTPPKLKTPRVLALRVTEKYEGDHPAKYGKTRALEELAAIAALWGHVPCLVRKPSPTLSALSRDILVGAFETRQTFSLPEVLESELLDLESYFSSAVPIERFSEAVRTQLKLHANKPGMKIEDAHPKVLLAALQADLAALARDAAGQKTSAADVRVVIFIDDLHISPAAGQLMTEWVSSYGLGRTGNPEPLIIPLVVTYSSVDKEVYKQNAAAIRAVAEAQPTLIANVDLRSLPSPGEDELPYHQFLLSQQKTFVLPANGDPGKRSSFFAGLHERVKGLPSRLEARTENNDVVTWVEASAAFDILVEANDEQIIAQLSQGGK